MGRRSDPIISCPGGTIALNIDPPVTPGTGHTTPSPTNPNAGWLTGDDAGGTTITIHVPTGIERKQYKYTLTLDGIGRLDPRIIIK